MCVSTFVITGGPTADTPSAQLTRYWLLITSMPPSTRARKKTTLLSPGANSGRVHLTISSPAGPVINLSAGAGAPGYKLDVDR